jgi:hypothetical protein
LPRRPDVKGRNRGGVKSLADHVEDGVRLSHLGAADKDDLATKPGVNRPRRGDNIRRQ